MKLTPGRALLVDYLLAVRIVTLIVLMCCAMVATYEFHLARREFAASNARWLSEGFRRVDAGLWKADTGLEIASAMRLDMGNLITSLRTQVKQSSDASTKASTTQSQAATAAVTNALAKTSEAIQSVSVAEVLPPKVELPAKHAIMPPVFLAPAESDGDVLDVLKVTPIPRARKKHWYRIWPWRRVCARN